MKLGEAVRYSSVALISSEVPSALTRSPVNALSSRASSLKFSMASQWE